jgi:hypothetical protein
MIVEGAMASGCRQFLELPSNKVLTLKLEPGAAATSEESFLFSFLQQSILRGFAAA